MKNALFYWYYWYNFCTSSFHSDDQLQLQSLEPISLDDIPEPIKVLDEIISEFEEAATKPVALHSNSGENQSEDDGYMSLSRKKWVKYMDIKYVTY